MLYLRDLPDADAIAERIARGGTLVVIGGGWIGAELEASAREKGLKVTIIQRSPLPLERVLGAQLGTIYRDLHLERGVELRSHTALEAFEGDGAVERVRMADGSTIDCDFVVVGVGVTPRTALVEAAGIKVDNGIVVNERLETGVPRDLRRGRCRQRLALILRSPDSWGALGQCPSPRARRCPGHAR